MKMKKKTKISVSLIVVVALICSVLAGFGVNSFAQTNGTLDSGLRWSLNDSGVFTVNGNGYGEDFSSSLTNSPPWRSVRGDIKKVIVQEGVQAIGSYWFYSCSNLTSVELPDSMYKMGAQCFRGCTSLENITIPENCLEYYNYVFYGCTSLKWAILPQDNKQWDSNANAATYTHTIPDNTFYGCTALENVWVGSGYTSIAASAFRNCSKLSAIVWTGSTISSIGSYFPSSANIVGASSLQSWCSSNSKNYININGSCGGSLSYAYNLSNKKLTLSGSGSMTSAPWNNWKYFIYDVDLAGATSVCDSAFYNCQYLDGDLDISDAVTSIGSNAFYGAGYDCYTVRANSVTVADTAFGGDEDITFYGKRNSGLYTYVTDRKTSYPDWKCYCISSHFYGDSGKCVYCDKVQNTMTIEPLGSHNYVYQYRLGKTLYYKCTHCTQDYQGVSINDLKLNFDCALTTTNSAYGSDYDGRFDIVRDGIINGRDYAALLSMETGNRTDYDMNLTNENATPETKALYRYIANTYKNKIISGQQESTWMGSVDYEMNYIKDKSGKYPAIRGLDFMNDDFSGCVSRAKAWKNKGGIVTICWHCGPWFNGSFNESQNETLTDEQWEAVLTDGTTENQQFLAAMDKAGNALLQLQDAGVPVLWRPFHEFDGAWFWWGKGGSDRFKRLWRMMYNHFTYDLGLNNLIWVLGYCHNGTDYGTDLADWYPGDRYCDIVGADSYEVSENGAEARLYNPVYKIVSDSKPMVMHETGLIPTVEQFEGVPWGYFMTWHTTYITEDNSASHINDIYNSSYVITLDELPGNLYDL